MYKYDQAVQESFGKDLKKQMLLVKIILLSLKFGKTSPKIYPW